MALVTIAVVVGIRSQGAVRVAFTFTVALVAVGGCLLGWSYFRDAPEGDFLDKLLADAGQALLLGAVLSYGFAFVGQQIDDERADRDLLRDNVRQVRVDAGGRVFDGLDVRGATLSGLDLRAFSFREADLSDANLRGANLSGADLNFADLSDANLNDTNLSGAILSGANLRHAVLFNADLTDADLFGADLRGAHLVDADLRGADLTDTDFFDTDLRGADLRGADLSDVLGDVHLSDVVCSDETRWPESIESAPPCN